MGTAIDLEQEILDLKRILKDERPTYEELLEASKEVAECLILESMRIPGFTKRRIEKLTGVIYNDD